MHSFLPIALLSAALSLPVTAHAHADQAASGSETAGAAPAPAKRAGAKKAPGAVCRNEIPTGSHFPVKVCESAEQRKAQQKAAQSAQDAMQSAMPTLPR